MNPMTRSTHSRMLLAHWLPGLLLALLLALPETGRAELEIDIIAGVEGAIPIAVVPFEWKDAGPPPSQDISRIVHDDLARSGQFKPMRTHDMADLPHDMTEVNFATWRLLQTDYLTVGRMQPQAGGGYEVRFELLDVHTGQRLLGYALQAREGELRQTAHQISDLIYEKIMGVPGAFNTRIAYVVVNQPGLRRYALAVADADGYGPQYAVQSDEPILSPSWSPDGQKLAYVSFEEGRSSIYVQDLRTGQREKLASMKGINGAPAWSPDGSQLAMALSRSGNLEIHVMDMGTRKLRQLTHHWAIDTEPAWMPDGKTILFTSDRAGRPRIYRIPAAGGKAERLSFEGDYNAKASVSPDGKQVAMVLGRDNDYRIAVQSLETGIVRILTPGFLDESPSFSPNGSMIIYAASEADRGVLAAVSADGRVRQRLVLSNGDVREPAWSPYRR